jgi:NADH:ubiquinone oxidoreductase subunit 3 (subunit A)
MMVTFFVIAIGTLIFCLIVLMYIMASDEIKKTREQYEAAKRANDHWRQLTGKRYD